MRVRLPGSKHLIVESAIQKTSSYNDIWNAWETRIAAASFMPYRKHLIVV
jgi:hypothetical protein